MHDNNLPCEYLTESELHSGCKLLLDTGADTCIAGKQTWVVEVVEGFTATAKGFDDDSAALEDLPIVNVKYAHDLAGTGEKIIIEVNHCIYIGARKSDGILCPNQLRMNGVYIDDRSPVLFPGVDDTQSIIVDGTKISLHMNGPLMEMHVRRPTLSEITNDDLQLVTLTSPYGWDPYGDESVTSYHVNSIMRVLPWGNPTITSMIYRKANFLGTTKRRSITVDNLMERWGVGKETAEVTLESTW